MILEGYKHLDYSSDFFKNCFVVLLLFPKIDTLKF